MPWVNPRAHSGLAIIAGLAALAFTASAHAADDDAFERRFKKLAAKKDRLVQVSLTPKENAASGPVLVSTPRLGLYTPPMLTSEDIQLVIQQHMNDIRACYQAQLDKDPEWADRLILDLAIKKTGRVGQVSVAPRRVKKAKIGRCLIRRVPKWTFPKFTGETDDGITQEVINASFPFSFDRN